MLEVGCSISMLLGQLHIKRQKAKETAVLFSCHKRTRNSEVKSSSCPSLRVLPRTSNNTEHGYSFTGVFFGAKVTDGVSQPKRQGMGLLWAIIQYYAGDGRGVGHYA